METTTTVTGWGVRRTHPMFCPGGVIDSVHDTLAAAADAIAAVEAITVADGWDNVAVPVTVHGAGSCCPDVVAA